MQLTFITIFLFGLLTYVSADALGIGYGSLYMQKDAKEGSRAQEKSAAPTSTTSPTSNSEYTPSRDEVRTIAHCYFHRHWERTSQALTSTQAFCQRLATNRPNSTEKGDKRNIFEAYLQVWNKMFHVISFARYIPTPEAKQEIEDCFFSRVWQGREESKLTAHDAFCKRLSTDMPSRVEVGWLNSFKAQRKVWLSMPEVARSDYSQMQTCFIIRFKSHAVCNRFHERVANPTSFRDQRLKEVYECTNPKKQHTVDMPSCMDLLITYKKMYYATK